MKTTDQHSIDNLLLREGGYPHLPESNSTTNNSKTPSEKLKHHPICDGRYPSLCAACNAEADHQSVPPSLERNTNFPSTNQREISFERICGHDLSKNLTGGYKSPATKEAFFWFDKGVNFGYINSFKPHKIEDIESGFTSIKEARLAHEQQSKLPSGHFQLPNDFHYHRSAWRNALVIAKNHAPDVDQKESWREELVAFDRAYAELHTPPTLEYCLGYTHEKCDSCIHHKTWHALNNFPNLQRLKLQDRMERINSDKCRMTNMGEYQPAPEEDNNV